MMEKPVEQLKKESQTKFAKNESAETPTLVLVQQKEYQSEVNGKNEPQATARPLENQAKISKSAEQPADAAADPLLWDCGSSLYDSFELKSFERQLDSAIHSRTLSMPHLSDRRVIDGGNHHQPPSQPPQPMSKKSSKISRSFHKFLRSVFKPKAQNGNKNPFFPANEQQATRDGFYVVYDIDKSGALSTIPEVSEFDGLSPEYKSLVTRTASDRFARKRCNRAKVNFGWLLLLVTCRLAILKRWWPWFLPLGLIILADDG
nr:uncharacterized protein LOC113706556 isoform X2 [Coffea arabica]